MEPLGVMKTDVGGRRRMRYGLGKERKGQWGTEREVRR
jgi:hypothetical protein